MYIKAEEREKEKQDNGSDPLKDGGGNRNQSVNSGLLSRRSNAPYVGPLSSLDLLHKPRQGIPSPNLYTDEEIAKNTDLNRRLGGVSGVSSNNTSPNSSLAPLDITATIESRPTVYKKSGELVKSSLKNRSKSLPTSPYVGDSPKHPKIQRSKSVHFDQRTPVKFFELDESPLASVSREGEVSELSFQHKGVGFFQEIQPPPPQEPSKPLRKSKRFDAFNKVKQPAEIIGIYPKNFPVISSRDPKVIQLNVFLSLSKNEHVFLQRLVLHASRKGASIEGNVMVKNICYHKRVAARYTWDDWQTVQEVECVYVCSGERFLPGTNTDMFSFMLEKPDNLSFLQLCVQYIARPERQHRLELWDNNGSQNYRLEVTTHFFRDPFA